MKIKRSVKRVIEDTLVDKVVCDLCKNEIEHHGFDVSDVTVSFRSGTSYPEGGSGEEESFDICATCFKERLRPWLESQGASPTVESWDW